jgi:HSP20 family molecular chaperone IbpA
MTLFDQGNKGWNAAGTGVKRKGTPTVLERAVKAVRAQGRPRLREQSPPINSAGANTGKRSLKQESARRPVMAKQSDGTVTAFEPPIVDEGPKADWVKINVHKHVDCFEIYALVPGLAREEVRIQCEPGGRLVIAGMPEDPDNPWGVTPFRKVISLPSRIDAHQTSAVVTLYGQLYVRVPIAESKSS